MRTAIPYKKPARIPFTREGYQEILKQQKEFLHDRPAAVENLKKAREMGDLSENGYYKAARQRLSFIDAQLRRLDRLVRFGSVIDKPVLTGVIGFGSTVTLSGAAMRRTFTIVGGYESNPAENSISHISPLGKALMGHKAGDRIALDAPKGRVEYTIESVT
ncbi:MAG: GreA/GreB family elongation factor [Patescibacteria group bacterium]